MSHDPAEIILICQFGGQEIFVSDVKQFLNSFVEITIHFFQDLMNRMLVVNFFLLLLCNIGEITNGTNMLCIFSSPETSWESFSFFSSVSVHSCL